MTKQKLVILNIIKDTCGHMSAEEIFFKAREVVPSISLSTVYRNLGQLVEERMINKIEIDATKCVYDRNIVLHGHMVDENTGEITDIFSEELDSILSKIVDKNITSYNLVIHYK